MFKGIAIIQRRIEIIALEMIAGFLNIQKRGFLQNLNGGVKGKGI
jgi:hypothetical protein